MDENCWCLPLKHTMIPSSLVIGVVVPLFDCGDVTNLRPPLPSTTHVIPPVFAFFNVFLPLVVPRKLVLLSQQPPHGGGVLAGGRGRGATMPAWMTDLGLMDKLNKKSHRKVTFFSFCPT